MTTRAELLEAMDAGRERWEALVHRLMDRLEEPGVVGTWAMRDVIAHVAAYERGFGGMLQVHLTGRSPADFGLTEKPPDELDGDGFNAWIVERARRRPVQEILDDERDAYELLRDAIARLPEADLFEAGRLSWMSARPVADALPNQCFGHYAMHEPEILAWLAAAER